MPALRKPHRIAILVPQLSIDGFDNANAPEAALLLWIACIEVCQRHPSLAVYDAESTPLISQDGHFVPQNARPGARPTDGFFNSTRRDELVWLELSLPKSSAVRLHTLARDGKHETFDALGKNPGEQIQQVFERWMTARGLPMPPRRFEAVEATDLISITRAIAPTLGEQARAFVHLDEPAWTMEPDAGADDDVDTEESVDEPVLDAPRRPAPKLGRALAAKLPQVLRVPALRTLALGLREDLDDLVLATDPEQPQALFRKFLATAGQGRDYALLRRIIAAAPCWARPYAELVEDPAIDSAIDAGEPGQLAPTELETVAGTGIAALCRPGHLDVIEAAADRLDDNGRIDEGVRFLERAVALHDESSRAHISLVNSLSRTDREGAWLAQAHASSYLHGCPMDPHLPWYPDQIQIDLLVADALLNVGRLDEAIALRANRLEGREATWPRHTRILTNWRKDPRFVAWCYAREGYFRGDRARTVEGFGRAEPADAIDLAHFLDALVATGREDEVILAWAQFGIGHQILAPAARLAAARCLLAAGEWRRGVEELWRVELTEPARDEQVAIARCGLLLSSAPIDVLEAALAERVAIGAHTLARRMARDIADFVPRAQKSGIVLRSLGQGGGAKPITVELDLSTLAGFSAETRSKKAIDALFADTATAAKAAPDDLLAIADRLVNRWLGVVFAEAPEDDTGALAQAASYAAAHALGRYLASTTQPPTPLAGAYRTVAAEALALVHKHRHALGDRDARALLGTLDPLVRRVDRWVGSVWLGTVERACAIDERANGDVAGFCRDYPTVAARILGPEETAVLCASVARLHRGHKDGWASAVAAQAGRLAAHTGYAGSDEWADALVAQLAAREIELEDAVDALHTACYLTEGKSAGPCLHAARVLLDAGRAGAAYSVLCAGLGAAGEQWRDRALATLAPLWDRVDVPLAFDKVAAQMFEALQKGDPVRAEKLGRFAVAFDPGNGEAHRNLGLAFAQQGKIPEAMHHLVRGTPEQATQILSGLLYQNQALPEAMAVLDYASRWYVRADQWLTYGGIAYAAMDNPRTVRAYKLALQLDPEAFDATQLNAYAGVLDEVGDYQTCEAIGKRLLAVAGDDLMWKTNAWNHIACALCGQVRFNEALDHAQRAVDQNPVPDNAQAFAATLERAKRKVRTTPPVLPPAGKFREPVFHLLDAGDFASAAVLVTDASWRVRRAALEATRFRFTSENTLDVTPRARAAATAILDDTVGLVDREAMLARTIAMAIREQAYFARDPVPRLGDRMTREAFYQEFRARGGVVIGEEAPPPAKFVDRIVVPGARIERASDYVSLLRDLATLTPREALAQFDLDENAYIELAKQWGAAIDKDPALAQTIAAGLAKR